MFKKLFRLLSGYIVVAAAGPSVERFINLAAVRGVVLTDVTFAEGAVRFSVAIKDFWNLRPAAKKCRCSLRIVRKAGLPFFIRRHRKRASLVVGAALFIALICWVTSFIWLVTVTGNDRLESAAILSELEALGVRVGGKKGGVNLRDVERGLLKAMPDIAWVNVAIKGTRAAVTLVETLPKAKPAEISGFCDIVAAKDGVIISMATEAGKPLVRPGDVVRAGDVLVSGELTAGDEDTGIQTYYIRAVSEIQARRYYEYVFDVPLLYTIKSFTGNVKRDYGIILGDKTLYLNTTDSPYENFERSVDMNRLSFGADYPLPVSLFTVMYREFIPVTVHRSLEEAEIMGATIVSARIKRELTNVTEIEATDITYTVNGDFLTVSAKITAAERIDEVKKRD